jgi:hypothetical protein
MKIGITLGIKKEKESMWINGIKMNAIFLQKALQKLGHTVYLLDTSNVVSRNKVTGKLDDEHLTWDSNEHPCYDFYKKFESMDVLFLLGIAIGPELVEKFKASGENKRVVKYACGNNYVIDMEYMIHKKPDEVKDLGITFNQNIDEVWYVPQQGYQNRDYYAVTHQLPREKVFAVPFVWDPMFIDEVDNLYSKESVDEDGNLVPTLDQLPIYIPGKKEEDLELTIFEPNLNVVKFSMIPTLIAEEALVRGRNFKKLHVVSAGRLYKNPYWHKFMQKLNLTQNKNSDGTSRLQVQHRFPIHYLLAKFTDIVISHQWENPLNYAYLDVMYLQFPLIHNADMIQDAGYYYPDFEIHKGADQLEWIMDNHDANIDAYNARNEEVMTRYTVYNEGLTETYGKLLDNLLAGENTHGLSLEYNWKTNLYYE